MLEIYIFIIGTVIGSFVNVCIYRLPRNKSIIFPPSHCPNCKKNLGFLELIPVVSYIFLMGRCKKCGCRISVQYPAVELLCGMIFLLLFETFGFSLEYLYYLMFSLTLVTLSFIDVNHQIIPDKIIVFGFAVGIIMLMIIKPLSFKSSLMGLLLGGGMMALLAAVSPGGMGGGDIKLMAFVGMMVGFEKTLLALFLAFMLGGIFSIILVLLKIKSRKDYIPFAPFIGIAAFLALIRGKQMISWYLEKFML